MEGNARTWFTPKQRAELWQRWKSGQCVADIARALERRNKSGVYRVLAINGGIAPSPRRRAPRALKLEEREEISRGIAVARSIRQIAQGLGRSPSTVSREIRRNGGCSAYRASRADRYAWDRALRPKPCRLARHAGIARDDLSQSLYSDTRCAEKAADGTPAHGAADAPSQGWHDEERTGTDRRCGFHLRTAGRGR